ncbi:uncharacterized protein LOC123686127 isoform X1 [Harmonia axyridis]|uniref:uncharacterized protein LOC123686127 isoform X1 n=1 Tax=Harmonia axyridis TaxID=115357 RepID=UPI001E279CD0|nr:uncharacterized protein LOC123686127 isoform X1 [Harmonia axyridis]
MIYCRMLKMVYVFYTIFVTVKMEDEEFINTIGFPFGGPFMGLFVTLSIPLGLKEEDVFLGYNMEANYVLPENQTSFSYPPILGERSITRSSVYQFLSNKLSRYGFPGYECLLRLICDTATHPINLTNGVLGDLLHVILTPSSSNETESLEAYLEAERQGIENENCFIYEKNCSYSILDFVTT